MSTSFLSVSTDDDCSPTPNDCSPDPADMHSLTNSMGNVTDTMTGLFNSFLRLSVALVVLAGLSAGAAMGQTVYVDGTASSNGGGSAASPYDNITDAIDGNANSVNNNTGVEVRIVPTSYDESPPEVENDFQMRTWNGDSAPNPGDLDIEGTVRLNGDFTVGHDPTPGNGGVNPSTVELGPGLTFEFGQNRVLNFYSNGSSTSAILGPGTVRAAVASGQLTINVLDDGSSASTATIAIDDLVVDKPGGDVVIQRNPSDPNTDALLVVGAGAFGAGTFFPAADVQPRFSVEGGTVDATNGNILFLGNTGFGGAGASPRDPAPVLNVNQDAAVEGLGTLISAVIGNFPFTAGGEGDLGMLFAQAFAPESGVRQSGTELEFTSLGNGGTSFVLNDSLRAPNLETINGSLTTNAFLGGPTSVLASSLTSITGDLQVALNGGTSAEVQIGGTSFDAGGGTTTSLAKSEHSLTTEGDGEASEEVDNPGEEIQNAIGLAEDAFGLEEFGEESGDVETNITAGPGQTALDINVPATFQGDFTANNSGTIVNFESSATFQGAFLADNGATLDFNGEAEFNGATEFDGGSATALNFRAPGGGVQGTSKINGSLDFTSGTVTLFDATNTAGGASDDGLHNLAINGGATFRFGGANPTIDLQEDGDDTYNQVLFAGGQTIDLRGGTLALDRLAVRDDTELTRPGSAGVLEITDFRSGTERGRLKLQDGVLTTNGLLDASGILLARYSSTAADGQIRSGASGTGEVYTQGRDVTGEFDDPERVEYKGARVGSSADPVSYTVGQELISPASPASDRTIEELAVNVAGQAATGRPVVTLSREYTVTDRLDLVDGNLSIGSAAITLGSNLDFYVGDGGFDPAEETTEEADVTVPNVSTAGSGGINLFYVNTEDISTGNEWPVNGASLDATGGNTVAGMDLINSAQIHPGGQTVNTESADLDDLFTPDPDVVAPGNVALRDGSTYRANGIFSVQGGVFDYNGQTLQLKAVGGSFAVYDITRPGAQEPSTDAGSEVQFVGLGTHFVLGATSAAGSGETVEGSTFRFPLTRWDNGDPSASGLRDGFIDIIDRNSAATDPDGLTDPRDGFQFESDFVVDNANQNDIVAVSAGLLAADADELVIEGDYLQNGGSAALYPNNRLQIDGDVVRDTKTDSSETHLLANDVVDIGGSVTQRSGRTDEIADGMPGESGLFIATAGNGTADDPTLNQPDENPSVVEIGGDVTTTQGVFSVSSGDAGFLIPNSQTGPEGVTIEGDYIQEGGVGAFTDVGTFAFGAAASVDVGDVNVAGGDFAGNFGNSGTPFNGLTGWQDRQETVDADALFLGSAAATTNAAKQQVDVDVYNSALQWVFTDVFGEGGSNDQPSAEALDFADAEALEARIASNTPEAILERIGGEESIDLGLPEERESRPDNGSGVATNTEPEDDPNDTYTVSTLTTISENARFFLGGFELVQGGDFTFEGEGDVIAANDPTPSTDTDRGLNGLITFNGDEDQEITVGPDPAQYLNSVSVEDESGVTLTADATLNTQSSGAFVNQSAAPTGPFPGIQQTDFNRPFATLYLDQGDLRTSDPESSGDNTLTVLEPQPTTNGDLIQAVNADETSPAGFPAPDQSPILGGTRNSHIVGTLRRAIEEKAGSTGGFVSDGYLYPMGRTNPETGQDEYHGLVLSLATDALGESDFFTVQTRPDPEIQLPDDLEDPNAIDEVEDERFTLDLNTQARPYFRVEFDEQPDQNFNVRSIAGDLGGVDEIKQVRILQRPLPEEDDSPDAWQLAGTYDATGDPNDDFPLGPNSRISGIPNIIHEGVDLRGSGGGKLLALATDDSRNPNFGQNTTPEFTATPGDLSVDVGDSETASFEAEDPDGDALSFSVSSTPALPGGTLSISDTGELTVEPDSGDASQSGNASGTTYTVEVTAEDDADAATASIDVEVGLKDGDANSTGVVNSADASRALNAFLEKATPPLSAVQTDAADLTGGGVGPDDAAAILDLALNGSSTIASKDASSGPGGTVVIEGADRSDGAMNLPVELSGDAENVRSVTVEVDLSGASQKVEDVSTNLPGGWIADHKSFSDGTLKIGMAGTSALSEGQIATIQLQDSEMADETSGTFRLNGSDAQDLDVQVSPESFTLNGNYPNPFSTSTTISYDLKEATNVSIEVYDVLGRKVGTLVNKKQSAGSYEVTLNKGSGIGAELSSGVYVYRIQAGDFTASEKMTVVK